MDDDPTGMNTFPPQWCEDTFIKENWATLGIVMQQHWIATNPDPAKHTSVDNIVKKRKRYTKQTQKTNKHGKKGGTEKQAATSGSRGMTRENSSGLAGGSDKRARDESLTLNAWDRLGADEAEIKNGLFGGSDHVNSTSRPETVVDPALLHQQQQTSQCSWSAASITSGLTTGSHSGPGPSVAPASLVGTRANSTSAHAQETGTGSAHTDVDSDHWNSAAVGPSIEEIEETLAANAAQRNEPLSLRGCFYKRASGCTSGGLVLITKPKSIEQDIVDKKKTELTEEEQELKQEMQEVVRIQLKALIGIQTNRKKEPGAPPCVNASGLPYMDPYFTKDITHPANQIILNKVAELAAAALKVINLTCCFKWCLLVPCVTGTSPCRNRRTGYVVTHHGLKKLAKITWHGFSGKFKAQVDIHKRRMMNTHAKNAQLARHREERSSVTEIFKKLYVFDPSAWMNLDYMSDEDSCPEPDSDGEMDEVSMNVWRKQMLKYLGYTGPAKNHDDVGIWEVVIPGWRTKFCTEVLRELSCIYRETLTPAEQQSSKYRCVYDSNRRSDKPALTVPFDFMINMDWWESAKEKYGDVIKEWMTYGDPEGFRPLLTFKILAELPRPLPDASEEDGELGDQVNTSEDQDADQEGQEDPEEESGESDEA
ncbi:hypothetical protein K439DRAFT_1622960 [Ramaria rubella]|nr:hypothetical protein K439DRAFT_1622960 [Ramaria rubella]